MIDWISLLFNSLWILGASLILAAWSYHHWLASISTQSFKKLLQGSSFLKISWFGLMLICIGSAGTSQTTWEIILWIILSVFSFINAILYWVQPTKR